MVAKKLVAAVQLSFLLVLCVFLSWLLQNLQNFNPRMRAKDLTLRQRYNKSVKWTDDSLVREKKNYKYPRNVLAREENDEPSISIIKYAFKTEAAAKVMEKDNTLIFAVDVRATKPQIKEAISKLYDTKVKKVNTLICFKSYMKKAFVRFKEEGEAIEIARRAGIL